MALREFTSISVSSYDAASLADRLTEKSAEGWEVVAIVPAGTNVTAYLSRAGSGSGASFSGGGTAAAAGAGAAGMAAGAGAAGAGAGAAGAGAGAGASSPWSQGAETASTGAGMGAGAGAGAATEASAPAGWYADPAGRYDLRYWDGAQWTEHVSRGGTQTTDPPVA